MIGPIFFHLIASQTEKRLDFCKKINFAYLTPFYQDNYYYFEDIRGVSTVLEGKVHMLRLEIYEI